MNKVCGNCRFFYSYADAYDDGLEPKDVGFCILYGWNIKAVFSHDSCDEFEERAVYRGSEDKDDG